jgi:hypothetical protein
VSLGVYVGGEYVWVGGEYEWLGGEDECDGVYDFVLPLDFHDPPPIRPPVPGPAIAVVTPKLATTTSTRAASDLTAAS